MKQEPLVSILMNCYNGGKYLREAIDSVLAGTYQNWEIIFWDDQSTDNSAEIFNSYDDPRLKYFYAPAHTLLYGARNFAIAKARGDFFAFLDVDDWWCPQKLERQMPLFEDPQVGFVCSKYWIVKQKQGTQKLFRRRRIPQGWVLNDLLADYSVGLLTLVIRRAAFDSLQGGFDARYEISGDGELVFRLAMKWKMACCQDPLAYYRLHGDNISQKQRSRNVAEFQVLVEELGNNPDVRRLSGFNRIKDELTYMKGRLCMDQKNKGGAIRYLNNLNWGKFKLKLGFLILRSALDGGRSICRSRSEDR